MASSRTILINRVTGNHGRTVAAGQRVAASTETLRRVARFLENGTLRPDIASVYVLHNVGAGPEGHRCEPANVHEISPSGQAGRTPHSRIVLRVAYLDAGHLFALPNVTKMNTNVGVR